MTVAENKGARIGDTGFLCGGGELGALMRDHDWSRSPLGPPAGWPQSLRTAVRLMLNTCHPMYIWLGSDLDCLYNDAYRATIGHERHPSSLGRPGREVWDEIWHIIGPQIAQVMSGGGPTWNENHLVPITRHGRHEDVYWTYSYSPIDDAEAPGGIGGVLVVCSETTDQVLAKRQLQAERDQFSQLFEQAPTFMAMLRGPEHRIELANPGYMQLVGHRDILGKTIAEALPDAVQQGYLELLDGVFASGKAFTAAGAKYAAQPVPGGPVTERYVDFVYQPVADADGRVVGIFVEGADVSDRTRANAALRESEARSRELNAHPEREVVKRSAVGGQFWQISPDLLGVLTPDAHFARVNPAWTTVLGWTEAEVQSMSIFELLHPDDVEPTRGGFAYLKQGNPILGFENRYRRKDGGYNWFAWAAAPLGDAYFCSGRDITAEKAARADLAQAQDALRQAQKMEAVGQLTGGIAHDFNNLLAAISGSLELLQHRMAEGRWAGTERYINAAERAARRAAALTQRLLAFSRRQTLDPRSTDVNKLINGMADLICRSVGPNVEIEVVGAGGLWATRIDSSQLESSLLNLCINARDAMAPDGGRLTIEAANKWLDERAAAERELRPGQYVSLCVTDTGTGMAPETIARAFDPFFTTKPLGEGTGLGLSMVYGFVRQSGGQVRIYSELGAGTTMCLYLPRYLGAAEEGAGETVLVVDDEPIIRMLIVEVLKENGYAAIEATDGPGALRILQSQARVDLLISDVGLPGGLNGRQLADAARQTRPGLKVLFITGYAENAAVGHGHLAAGMEVITKPFVMATLGNKIRHLIDR